MEVAVLMKISQHGILFLSILICDHVSRNYLNHQHAGGRRMRWAHRKGVALVRYLNGEIWLAEVHWFEANGIGRRDETVKYRIRRIG